MGLQKEIQHWLKSEEFKAFYDKAEYTMALIIEGQGENLDHLQEHMIEMGRRYNHFIFCVTEEIIHQAKKAGLLNHEDITSATSQFIVDLEKAIEKEHPFVFTFFLSYRKKANEAKKAS